MQSELILAVVGTGGAASITAAVLSALQGRRKLTAEATQIITDAAAGVVKTVQEDNRDLRARISQLESDNEAWRYALQLHVAWDQLTIAKLKEYGVELPAAPPLYPPAHKRDAQ